MNTKKEAGADWDLLITELDAWERAGKMATFWWRDDDAVADSAALQRLLEITQDVPLSIAVVPRDAQPSLQQAVRDIETLDILQHGYAHANHAPAGEKKAELGDHRPHPEILEELAGGFQKLRQLFGNQFKPVMVPPWNRISPALARRLNVFGIAALSTYGDAYRETGAVTVNTHVDIIDWRNGRCFLGVQQTLALIIRHLTAKRTKKTGPVEPTGLLTHHLVQDPDCWSFLAALTGVIKNHRAAKWNRPFESLGTA